MSRTKTIIIKPNFRPITTLRIIIRPRPRFVSKSMPTSNLAITVSLQHHMFLLQFIDLDQDPDQHPDPDQKQ